MEINKYYYIDESGRSVECLKTGKFPNKFMPNKTGHMGFKDRQGIAKTVWILISLMSKIYYRTSKWHVRSREASIIMKIYKKHITHRRMISSRATISFPGQLLHPTRTNLMCAIWRCNLKTNKERVSRSWRTFVTAHPFKILLQRQWKVEASSLSNATWV